MTNKLISSIPAIILGLLIAFAPKTFAQPCPPMEDGHFMKCHWSAQAALGIGLVIAVIGVIAFFVDTRIQTGLAIAAGLNGALTIAIVKVLIGGCMKADMHCNMIMVPTLMVLGILTIVYAVVVVYVNSRVMTIAPASQK